MNIAKKLKDITLKNMLILMTYCAFLILCLIYFQDIVSVIGEFFSILQPFIIGFALAFIFNIPMKHLIKKLPIQNEKTKKNVAALLSIALVLGVVVIALLVILPQIISNVRTLISNLPETFGQLQNWLTQITNQGLLSSDIASQIEDFQKNFANKIVSQVTMWAPSIALGVTHVTGTLVNVFMGVVMAIYMLFSKDTLLRQVKKVGHAFLDEKRFNQVSEVCQLTSTTFENFLAGQLVEACILGILCYIGCVILDIPYASIASLVIGMTNIIPYFGPIIGAVISCILIVFVSPVKAVIFLIFSTLLQQFESNLIYPHVVGNSVGLSALWVLFAVTVGGGLFGIIGMVFGLPTFSVIYELMKRIVNKRLRTKKISVES